MDLSGTGCGCVGTIYLVNMSDAVPQGPQYCDILHEEPCYELDVFEGNQKGCASTLHFSNYDSGWGTKGTCDQWGSCQASIQNSPHKFWPGGDTIDTTKPFEVRAQFPHNGAYTTTMWQGSGSVKLFEQKINAESLDSYLKALKGGLVLTTSLWSGEVDWLDGGCKEPKCDIDTATFTVSNMRITSLGEDYIASDLTPLFPTPVHTPPTEALEPTSGSGPNFFVIIVLAMAAYYLLKKWCCRSRTSNCNSSFESSKKSLELAMGKDTLADGMQMVSTSAESPALSPESESPPVSSDGEERTMGAHEHNRLSECRQVNPPPILIG